MSKQRQKALKEHELLEGAAKKAMKKQKESKDITTRTKQLLASGGGGPLTKNPQQHASKLVSMLPQRSMPNHIRNSLVSLMLPGQGRTLRGPTTCTPMQTVVATPYVEYQARYDATVSSDPDLAEHFVAVSKNPLLGIIWSTHIVPTYTYNAQFRTTSTGATQTSSLQPFFRFPVPNGGATSAVVTVEYEVNPVMFTFMPNPGLSDDTVAGSIEYTVKNNGKTWWLNHCETATVNFSFSINGVPISFGTTFTAIQAKLYTLSGENNETLVWEGNLGSNNVWTNMALLGFYRAVIIIAGPANGSNPSVDITMTIRNNVTSTAQTCLYSRPHAGFTAEGPGWDYANARVNAIGLCVSNTSPVIYLSGSIAGNCFPDRSSFLSFLNGDYYYQQLTRLSGTTTGKLADGMYGYARPTALSSNELAPLVFKDATTGAVVGFDAPAFPPGGWTVIAIARDITQPLNLVFRLSISLEGVPYTNFYNSQHTDMSGTDWQIICDIINKMPQFTENPEHVSKLWGFIKNATTPFLRNAPEVLKLLSTVFPALRIPGAVADLATIVSRHV